MPIAHAWTLGLDLDEVLDDETVSGGDFVRQVRQLVDLLGQVAAIAPLKATRRTARDALERRLREERRLLASWRSWTWRRAQAVAEAEAQLAAAR